MFFLGLTNPALSIRHEGAFLFLKTMETKINNENKARFFALYWYQFVGKEFERTELGHAVVNSDSIKRLDYLHLKPIESINDEDAIGMVLFCEDLGDQKDFKILSKHGKEIITYDSVLGTLKPHHYDFLRSKGYAIPWMGISVEHMVFSGWLKLK